jgi:hypothetical protein
MNFLSIGQGTTSILKMLINMILDTCSISTKNTRGIVSKIKVKKKDNI